MVCLLFPHCLLTACQFGQPHQEALARLLRKTPPFVISLADPTFSAPEEARLAGVGSRGEAQKLHAIGWETFLGEALSAFLHALAHLPGEVILVLENYQTITSPHLHESVAFFLDHLPAQVHLSMLTRSEPSLPLAHLRASGRLCEVTGRDLRFSLEEMSAFLQRNQACASLISGSPTRENACPPLIWPATAWFCWLVRTEVLGAMRRHAPPHACISS